MIGGEQYFESIPLFNESELIKLLLKDKEARSFRMQALSSSFDTKTLMQFYFEAKFIVIDKRNWIDWSLKNPEKALELYPRHSEMVFDWR